MPGMRRDVTEDAFRQLMRPYVKDGIPFLAYWHPTGMGIMRLDTVRVPYLKDAKPVYRDKKVGPRALKTWEKNLERLRRDSWGRVVSVEFDGKEAKTEGEFVL